MKTSSHFSSKHSAIILGSVLVASTLFAGVTFAQLNIPTNLSNAAITIQKIFLSPTGVSIDQDPAVKITLNGGDGNLSTKGNISTSGNVTVGGQLQFTRSDYKCPSGATGCILKVDANGVVLLTNDLSGSNEEIFKRTGSDPRNIFLATTDGSEAVAGKKPTQSYLRVGITEDDLTLPVKHDTAMVVGGSIESRGGLYIKKSNLYTDSNSGDNLKTVLSDDYTSLQVEVNEVGGINFLSNYSNGGAQKNTSFLFSANGASTKVGINIPDGQEPDANLQVAGSGTLLVGNGITNGFCCNDDKCPVMAIQCTTNTQCTDKTYPTCMGEKYRATLFANGAGKVGVNTVTPHKALDIVGDAAISSNLTIGHYAGFDPGTDKLAVNGSTRANAYYYNSDRRYKSDIEVLKSPLANLLKLSGYSYYNTLSEKKDLGVIAQEVESVYPELVQTDAEGYKSVEYGNLVAPIIEAIKELATKIDHLFTLYVSQQAKIDILEARLLRLESQVK